MTTFKILGAAAILASALAGPALAQEVIYNPGYCAQFYPNANCQNKGPGNPYTGDYQRQNAYRHNGQWHDSYNRWDGDAGAPPGTWFAAKTAAEYRRKSVRSPGEEGVAESAALLSCSDGFPRCVMWMQEVWSPARLTCRSTACNKQAL